MSFIDYFDGEPFSKIEKIPTTQVAFVFLSIKISANVGSAKIRPCFFRKDSAKYLVTTTPFSHSSIVGVKSSFHGKFP